MSDNEDVELYEQAVALLEPGEKTLVGVVVHTDLRQQAEPAMNRLMRTIGDRIGEATDAGETYIYAGEDDERFGVGQFHGRRLEDDEVVWECQQLLREGTFDLVFYWEENGGLDDVVSGIDDLDVEVVPVREDGFDLD
ncbi:MAG: DUF5778 family protein [Halodesulfurarchaeum sp.]